MSKSNFDKIVEFHVVSGLAVSETPQKDIFKDDKTVDFRYSLIKEEGIELTTAIKEKDHVEIIDALADLEYVINGAGATFGVNLNDMLIELLENNDLHGEGLNGSTVFEIVQSRIASHLARTNGLVINNSIDYDLIDSGETKEALKEITDRIETLAQNIREKNFDEMCNTLMMLLYSVYAASASWGINLDQAYDIVHKSNMTKFCSTEEEAKRTVIKYRKLFEQIKNENNYPEGENEVNIKEWFNEMTKKGINVYDSPTYRLSKDGIHYVVFNKSTKKILKSINYTPADFDEMM